MTADKIEENKIRSMYLVSQAKMMNVICALQSEVDNLEENSKVPRFLLARKKNQIETIIAFNNAVEDLLFSKSTEIEVSKAELAIARKVAGLAMIKKDIQEIELSDMIKKRRETLSKLPPTND